MWLIHKNRKHIKKQQQFAECFYPDTRQSNHFSISWKTYLPSVITLALGEVSNFAECQGNYTRQIRIPGNRKMVALPSVRVKTLGKACCFFIFSVFYVITTSIRNKAYIHSRHLI